MDETQQKVRTLILKALELRSMLYQEGVMTWGDMPSTYEIACLLAQYGAASAKKARESAAPGQNQYLRCLICGQIGSHSGLPCPTIAPAS